MKRIISLILCVLLLAGCAPQQSVSESSSVQESSKEESSVMQESSEEEANPLIVMDQIGREVKLEKPAESLVSTYYISTSLLVLLGAGEDLAGIEMKADTRTLYQQAAPHLLELPAVGSGKEINIEQTAALAPDLVIIPKKLKDSVEALEAAGLTVLVVNPETEAEFYECVELLGIVTGRTQEAEAYMEYCNQITAQVSSMLEDVQERPEVYLSSASSYQSTSTSQMYQTELIERAGGRCVSEELEDSYWQEVSDEQIAAWNPQYWFMVTDADYTAEDIVAVPGLAEVNAVQENKILTIPSGMEPWDYPTSSSILGLAWMGRTLHPEQISQEWYEETVQNFYQEFFGITVELENYGM